MAGLEPTDTSSEQAFIEALRGLVESQVGARLTALEEERLPELELSKIRPAVLGPSRMLEWARRAYQIRRYRRKQLPDELFGEPAWDILLDLYIAFHEAKTVSVSSACIGADVPTTTALRWLRVLEEAGLVQRIDDINDKRVTWVCLTRKAILAISRICEEDERRRAATRKTPKVQEEPKQEKLFDW